MASDEQGDTGTERCDECGGAVVETAAGRECEDCKKRFRPPVTDGGTERVGVNCAGCNTFVQLGNIKHIRRGRGFCASCGTERFGGGSA